MERIKGVKTFFLVFLISALAGTAQGQEDKWLKVQDKMKFMTSNGVPGMVLGVRKDGDSKFLVEGYADIATGELMTLDHSQYLQSITKTFIGVAVLQLLEQGKIDLESSIDTYLPPRISDWIEDSDKMTVRMMLNHTSGLPEYNYLPEYITLLLQQEDYPFEPQDYLKLIEGKSPDFEPGSKYSYRNSNYVLLALLLDEVTGDHARFIRENIFQPLNMEHSYYRETEDYLAATNLPKSYWDRYGNGIIEDATEIQRRNVKRMVGDDGMVLTVEDGLKFIEGIIELKLISEVSLEKMTEWVRYTDGSPAYGLGLDYTEFSGQEAWGHNGGGIGAGATLHYFPKQGFYVFLAMNLGTVTGGKIHEKLEPELEELYRLILKTVE